MTIILTEYLTVNSVAFATPNVLNVDVVPLLRTSQRGDNVLIPGLAGRLPVTLKADEITETVEVLLRGDVDADGASIANPRSGLRSLIHSLRGSVVGTWAATLTFPAASYTATVQVTRFDPVTSSPTSATLLLQVVVPAGGWTLVP